MKFKSIYCILLIFLIVVGCNKWPTTEDLSHVSELPVFTFEGSDFVVYEPVDSGEYVDSKVTATSNGKELSVYSYYGTDSVDLQEVGVYIIYYYAENADGISNTAQKIVVVRKIDVTKNDLSATYSRTVYGFAESDVKKIDPQGLYKVEDVLGYPGASMPGKFVDMGNNDLVLINGEGDFGRYGLSEGSYSRSALNWTIHFIDPPYDGIDVPVTWYKEE